MRGRKMTQYTKWNKKKLISVTTMLVLSASLTLTGCSSGKEVSNIKNTEKVDYNKKGLPIVDKKVTLNFVAPKAVLAPDYGDMTIFKELEKKTNVHIRWKNIPGDGYQEKKNLMLASGDLPDAFYSSGFSDSDIVKYGQNGTIVPLEKLIDKYAPNLKKRLEERPELKKIITAPDGHIYSLPRAEEMGLVEFPNEQVINKKWLDKLGLPVPKTIEEYHQALKAFKEKDPNGNGKQDEIPMSFTLNGWCGDIGDLFGAFGMPDNTDHRIVKNGKVIFTAAQPEYKEAIKYYHKWVKEGLIDPESFTQTTPQFFAKGKTSDETLGSYLWWETEEVVGPERAKDYVLMPALKGPKGDQMVGRSNYSEYGRDALVITSANQNPELTMRWVDQLYAPKESAQVNWGPIGEIYKEDPNGMLVNKELPEGVAMGELRQKVAPGGPFIVLKDDFGKVVDMEPRAKQRLKDLDTYYKPYMAKENYPQVFFNAQDLEKVNQIETEIKTFVNQKRAHWLRDGGIDKEWDGYVAQLNSMGLNELMKIYQKGLDDFNKK
jgi:putative aldouronate transport system substrate-binding protein